VFSVRLTAGNRTVTFLNILDWKTQNIIINCNMISITLISVLEELKLAVGPTWFSYTHLKYSAWIYLYVLHSIMLNLYALCRITYLLCTVCMGNLKFVTGQFWKLSQAWTKFSYRMHFVHLWCKRNCFSVIDLPIGIFWFCIKVL
jgi:hypothetical protein